MGNRIVLGLGNCVDYEAVWSSAAVGSLVEAYGIEPHELSAETAISSVRDLVVSLLGFFQASAGGERYVPSPDILLHLASHFETAITVGGTSLRAAIAMRKLGYASTLHLVSMNPHVREGLPKGCEWVCSEDGEAVYPHLIIQFPKGARVRVGDLSLAAERSNRVIYVHDPCNDRLRISPRLAALSSDARVFLVSGLNAMRDGSLLAARLRQLREILASLPGDAVVYYEDAAFHDPELGQQVRDALLEHIDIYGLNEDELQQHLGRRVPWLDPAGALSAIRELSRMIPVPTLVVHTADWAAAFGTGAGRFRSPLEAGVAMACTRMRLGDDFIRHDILETGSMPVRQDGAAFSAAINALGNGAVCCVPSGSIDEHCATSVGLGDAFVGGFLPRLLE